MRKRLRRGNHRQPINVKKLFCIAVFAIYGGVIVAGYFQFFYS